MDDSHLQDQYYACSEEAPESASAQTMMEINAIELNALDTTKYEFYDVTVDFGAGAPVVDPR